MSSANRVALNFLDILLCQGKYQEKPPLPFTPGAEIAGTVKAADEGSEFEVGQKVLARPALPNGGFAEWVSVPEASVFRVPESMSFQEAAAMYITYQTAYYALHDRANIKAGDVLLVHAGSGEVAIDYRAEDFVDTVKKETDGRGADIIFDPVGSDTFDRSRKCINFAGRILVVGFAGGRIPEAPTNHALVKNYSIVGVHWGYFARLYEDEMVRMHHTLCDMYEEGKIKPLIYDEFPFEDVPHALDLLGDRKTYGKVVVDVGGGA